MSSPARRSGAARRRPPRPGFGRLVVLLVLVLVAETVWRSGVFGRHGDHLEAKPIASSGRFTGPPVADVDQAAGAVSRLASLGYPVSCGGGTKPLVALTFDDGPGPYTQKTVGILKRAGARATFFIVGRELIDWPGLGDMPRTELTVAALGDHTWDHADLLGVTQDQLDQEIAYSKQVIESHAGGAPVRLFRPPYGHHDDAVDREVRSLGMLQVLWSVDSRDGTGAPRDEVLANVLHGVRPGSIVVMHENRGTTLRILPTLLRRLHERGLRPVSVPELLAADPPSSEQLRSGSCP